METEVFQSELLKKEKDSVVIQAFLPLPVRMSTQPGDHLIPPTNRERTFKQVFLSTWRLLQECLCEKMGFILSNTNIP